MKDQWSPSITDADIAPVLDSLCAAVLVVRHNLAHGEKTPAGPDRERAKRNREVAAKAFAVLEDIVDVILDGPSHKLAAYGTLRPGQPNSGMLAADGAWCPVTLLDGVIREEQGLPVFTYAKNQTAQAELFESRALPALWPSLDEFEGVRYERVLGLHRHEEVLGVANIYMYDSDWD